jgi:hypothetical protein
MEFACTRETERRGTEWRVEVDEYCGEPCLDETLLAPQ